MIMTKFKHDIKLSNLDKIFWPDESITKGDVLDYYYKISKFILPQVKDRPMVLNRHPNGILHENFFQKQAPKETPPWIKTTHIQHTNKITDYILVQNVETLLYVANLGCIELNPFHSHVPNLLFPDYCVIDLDPEDISFNFVIEVALAIHELLNTIGAPNYCKTSGGRGLHIYVPLHAKYTFQQSQDFALLIGTVIKAQFPKLVSLERSPRKRQKQIYVDYLRNSTHQTVACAYCVRPKPHAPVSAPLSWDEVNAGLNPLDFNIHTMPERLKIVKDLFKPVLGKGIDLKSCLKELDNKYNLMLNN